MANTNVRTILDSQSETASLAAPLVTDAINDGSKETASLVEMFTRSAARAPQALALRSSTESFSYEQLDVAANQLAHYLISLGIGPETTVAICLERSVGAVISALAVLKAGGAYLPLDPSYPGERLSLMINDALPHVILTRNHAAKLPKGMWTIVDLDVDEAFISRFETTAPDNQTQATDLAYVIYTSGSTGEPKGVEITHGSLMNLVLWHQQAFEITSRDRASLLASVGFDASVWETWPYLAAGASLHIPNDETRVTPEHLRDWLVSERISISFLPTVLAERLMLMKWPAETSMRILLTGADTLRRFPTEDLPFTVINNYGPTECTVVATSGVVAVADNQDSLPTIGRPISNTTVYLLDDILRPAPVGSVGELYIGGAGVARGYLNRPELTEEKFIKDPFSLDPGARLYRTGDLARLLLNGEIAYVGRADDQIKIMGYRIEPNEIIAVLNRHPQIQASTVIARGGNCSEKNLVAYVVTSDDYEATADDLRAFLKLELPDHMVPSIFVKIDSLPVTRNGKLDLEALPVPDASNTLWDDGFTAPSTPLEERLAEMLSTLLDIQAVSVNDNFFLLGGHSLLGTQLIGQIRAAFGVDLTLRALFEAPTIAQLAFEVEELLRSKIAAMSEEEVAQLLA